MAVHGCVWTAVEVSDHEPLAAGHRGLDRVSAFCRVGLDRTGVDAMAVTFANGFAGLEVLLATDPLSERVAQLEFTLGEGPSVDAVASRMPTIANDLDSEVSGHRWPLFAAEAVQMGIRALHAYPIVFSRRAFGTVGLYARDPMRLTSEQHGHATDITELIGLALVDPRSSESIGSGLRMTVHQAAGMVMQQMGMTIHDALVLLRSTAFTEDRRVTDLADDVIAGRRRFGEAEMTDD
ncbi:MAG TPA: GAF and ANTAR domain-containing protein [Marmoricola sp.]|nr:GAF and ANTAR domain-containing protein [Marmoricola sp.]